jgi:PilZ domain-containing protein
MSSFSVPPNERLHPRTKVSKDAKVIYPDERGFTDVLIRDMSVGGARIQLKSSTDLSGEFNLYIPPEKEHYTAAVRWMRGDLVGLQFKSTPGEAKNSVNP